MSPTSNSYVNAQRLTTFPRGSLFNRTKSENGTNKPAYHHPSSTEVSRLPESAPLFADQNPNTSPGKPMNPYNESGIEPSTVDCPGRPDFIIFDLWFIIGIHSHNMSQLIASYLLLEICCKYVYKNHAMLLANVMYTVVFLPRRTNHQATKNLMVLQGPHLMRVWQRRCASPQSAVDASKKRPVRNRLKLWIVVECCRCAACCRFLLWPYCNTWSNVSIFCCVSIGKPPKGCRTCLRCSDSCCSKTLSSVNWSLTEAAACPTDTRLAMLSPW